MKRTSLQLSQGLARAEYQAAARAAAPVPIAAPVMADCGVCLFGAPHGEECYCPPEYLARTRGGAA